MTNRTLPPVHEMRAAHQRRDTTYDGVFYLGVKSTGIFCKPSCPARQALAKNIEYFANVKDAMFAGYRPCKRCKPLEAPGTPPPWVSRLIAKLEQQPDRRITERDLKAAGIAPDRARRWFQRHYGMTFHAFARGFRLRRKSLSAVGV